MARIHPIRLSPRAVGWLCSGQAHHFGGTDLMGFAEGITGAATLGRTHWLFHPTRYTPALMAVSRDLAVLQPIRHRHRRAFFLAVLLGDLLAGLLHRDHRRRLCGGVSRQAKLLQTRALGANRSRDGCGFRRDGLADIDTRQLAEMSIGPTLYHAIRHYDLPRADLPRACSLRYGNERLARDTGEAQGC